MKRFKSIDIFRGICMLYMIIAHLSRWWLQDQYLPPLNFFYIFIEPLGASGFLFISGLSIALSFKNKYLKIKLVDKYTYRRVRNEFFIKAVILMGVALLYNLILSIATRNFSLIWSWFILLTAAISLFFAFPLLHLSNLWRVLISIILIVFNQILYAFTSLFEGELNFFGIAHYILYSGYDLTPILSFFPFFLIGTVIGDLIHRYICSESGEENHYLKKKMLLNLILTGITLTILGIFFSFPSFMLRQSFSWVIHSIGIEVLLISILIYIEELKIIKVRRNFKFFFYFSYYSLTVYLGHNVLALIFWKNLTPYLLWPILFITVTGLTLFLKFMFNWKSNLISIKYYIGSTSTFIAKLIEKRKGLLKLIRSSSPEINI